MKELRTEIEIAAMPESVWGVLTDFAAFPQWNPFIREASGERKVGKKLRIRVVPSGGRGMVFKPTVLACEPNRELRWFGRLPMGRVLDGATKKGFEAINVALKERVEKTPKPS
jgi:hypothetical protein